MVCVGCPDWDECFNCSIARGSVTSTCEAPLEHTLANEDGVTLDTLSLENGYWRATSESDHILACYNEDACIGGQTGATNFCASGYTGPCEWTGCTNPRAGYTAVVEIFGSPFNSLACTCAWSSFCSLASRACVRVHVLADCAVCETGFAPALAHACTRCSSSRREGLIAVTVIAALVTLCAIVTIFRYLLSTEHEHGNIGCIYRGLLRAVPLQALKIILVVWQILTQVCHSRHRSEDRIRWISEQRYTSKTVTGDNTVAECHGNEAEGLTNQLPNPNLFVCSLWLLA